MSKPTLQQYWNDLELQTQMDAAARRTRAWILQRILGHAWRALLSAG